MLRGVAFRAYINDLFLSNFPGIISVTPFDWIIDDVAVCYGSEVAGKFTGEEFKAQMENNPAYMFARIRRYPSGAVVSDVEGYDEYMRSECSLVLFCVDSHCYEFYSKSDKEVLAIYNECLQLEYTDVELTTDKNDGRYSFHV